MAQHPKDRTIAKVGDDETTAGFPGRRSVLRGGLVVPVGVGLTSLAACGSEESGPATGGNGDGADAGESGGSGEAAAEGFPIAEVPVGGATYDKDSKTVYSQPTEGDFRAFDSTCPHQGCAVSLFEDGQMVCPCHSSSFDPDTGDVTGGPATAGLAPRDVTVDGTNLVLG